MKTLLFSISNVDMHRNFCAFERSVLDILRQHTDLRIVIVTRKGQTLRGLTASERVVIEAVEEITARNFLQGLFYFFYSFLIFTDTTKLVSSYGVRADKPRSITRYYNYPLKWLIAHSFGKSTWVKEKLVPRLYLMLFRDRPYKHLFDDYKPDLAFLPNVCTWPNDLKLLIEAERSHVPTLGMHGSWDHFSKYFVPFRPDRLLVWSEPVRKEAIDFQSYRASHVVVTGAPQADFFLRKDSPSLRSDFLASMKLPQDCTLISFASQGPYSLDGADLVDMILGWISDSALPDNTYLIIRPHPSGIMEKEKYERFKSHPRVRIDDVRDSFTLQGFRHYIDVLFHASVVVTTYSTVGPDAVLLDKPVVIAGFDGYKTRPMYQSVKRHRGFTHYQMILRGQGVYHATSPREFLEYLKLSIANPEGRAEGRAVLRRQVFGMTDGGNSARIAREVLRALNHPQALSSAWC